MPREAGRTRHAGRDPEFYTCTRMHTHTHPACNPFIPLPLAYVHTHPTLPHALSVHTLTSPLLYTHRLPYPHAYTLRHTHNAHTHSHSLCLQHVHAHTYAAVRPRDFTSLMPFPLLHATRPVLCLEASPEARRPCGHRGILSVGSCSPGLWLPEVSRGDGPGTSWNLLGNPEPCSPPFHTLPGVPGVWEAWRHFPRFWW